MYSVQYTERLEDWYVSEGDSHAYECLEEAVKGFDEIVNNLLDDTDATQGLRIYIEDFHSDDEDLDSYAIGMVVNLYRDDILLVHIDIAYDPRSATLKIESSLSLEYENMQANEFELLNELSLKF